MASLGISFPNKGGGINLCCCRIFTCINFGFLTSKIGLLKVVELLLAGMCNTLLVKYGFPYAESIGQALYSFLATTACCSTTTMLLLVTYCFSERSAGLMRQTLFEPLFNAVAVFMYASSSSYMGFACMVWLHPQFLIKPGFWAYPAMTAVYYMGYVATLVHAFDAYLAWKQFRGVR